MNEVCVIMAVGDVEVEVVKVDAKLQSPLTLIFANSTTHVNYPKYLINTYEWLDKRFTGQCLDSFSLPNLLQNLEPVSPLVWLGHRP